MNSTPFTKMAGREDQVKITIAEAVSGIIEHNHTGKGVDKVAIPKARGTVVIQLIFDFPMVANMLVLTH